MTQLFSFPNPVNETSARVVAAGVVLQAALFLVFREGWLLVPLATGFLARVLTGPTLSPLGQFATRVATPRIGERFGVDHRFAAGPPKRFAQGIGLVVSSAAVAAWLIGAPVVAVVLVVVLIGAATLEATAGVCVGCMVYRRIRNCEDCDDITARMAAAGGMAPSH